MTDRDLTQLLGGERFDPGCDDAFTAFERYVEAELAARDAEALLPGIAEHLRNCSACAEDHEGLLALARGET